MSSSRSLPMELDASSRVKNLLQILTAPKDPSDGRYLAGSACGVENILHEISHTIMARRITLKNPNQEELALEICNGRLLELSHRRAGVCVTHLTGKDLTYAGGRDLARLFAVFHGFTESYPISVHTSARNGGTSMEETGISAETLRQSWQSRGASQNLHLDAGDKETTQEDKEAASMATFCSNLSNLVEGYLFAASIDDGDADAFGSDDAIEILVDSVGKLDDCVWSVDGSHQCICVSLGGRSVIFARSCNSFAAVLAPTSALLDVLERLPETFLKVREHVY